MTIETSLFLSKSMKVKTFEEGEYHWVEVSYRGSGTSGTILIVIFCNSAEQARMLEEALKYKGKYTRRKSWEQEDTDVPF